MQNLIDSALNKKKWAVLGATEDKAKFGYKVFKKLISHNYEVYPVNPQYSQIENIKCYPELDSISEKFEVISMIINPIRGIELLKKADLSNVKFIWCQPGAESEEIVKFAADKGIAIIYSRCVLVELG